MTSPLRHAYGSHPAQYAELWLPDGPRRPGTVVLIHGGLWQAAYDAELGRPLAADLVARGYAVWNLEYRRVGAGGGWPATGFDVATGVDTLAAPELAPAGLDLDRVVVIGHSAGGQLAVWVAGRSTPAPAVRVTGVIAQAALLDLARAARTGVGDGAVLDLLGGGPEEVPDRYAAASPIERLPIEAPVLCVHSRTDAWVPFEQSERYVAAAGSGASLLEVTGDHRAVIEPATPAWQATVDRLPGLLAG